MSNAKAVAQEFARLAKESGHRLNTVRLQKLLYYAQAWSLAVRDWQLFEEPMEAWVSGPVVRSIYDFTTRVGSMVPPHTAFGPQPGLSDEEARLVQAVWQHYRRFSKEELIDMTHGDGPWSEARAGIPDEARSNKEISLATVAEVYQDRNRPKPVAAFEQALIEAEEAARATHKPLTAEQLKNFGAASKSPPPEWYDEAPIWFEDKVEAAS